MPSELEVNADDLRRLRDENARLIDALSDMVKQHCHRITQDDIYRGTRGDLLGSLYSCCLSSDSSAMEVLCDIGVMEWADSGVGRDVGRPCFARFRKEMGDAE